MKTIIAAMALSLVPFFAHADEFPDKTTTPKSEEIKQFLEGKVYMTKYANGASQRYDFRSNGTIYVNPSVGPSLSGLWSTKEGQVCTEIRGSSQCSDVRMLDGGLILRRANGEIVTFVAGS